MPADSCPRCRRPLATYDDEKAAIGGVDVPDGLCWRGVQSSAEDDCQIAALRAERDAIEPTIRAALVDDAVTVYPERDPETGDLRIDVLGQSVGDPDPVRAVTAALIAAVGVAEETQARLDALTAPVEGVDVEAVLRLDREATPGPWRAVGASIRVTLLGGIEYQWATASYPRDTALVVNYRTAAPALAREVVALRDALATAKGELDIACREWGLIESALDAAGVAATHADGDARSAWNRTALLARERDAACHALAICEGERDAWRAVARVAPAVTCAGCGKARTADPAASDPGPCPVCGQRAGLAWLVADPLTVLALTAERDDLRLTLAAERGEPEGAPSEGWCNVAADMQDTYWQKATDRGVWAVTPTSRIERLTVARGQHRRASLIGPDGLICTVYAMTDRAAMLAADEVKP